MTFSGHTTRSVEPGWIVRVAWQVAGEHLGAVAGLDRMRALRTATLDDGDAQRAARVRPARRHPGDRQGRRGRRRARSPRTRGASRSIEARRGAKPIWNTTQVSSSAPPTRDDRQQRAGRLADRQAGQRHAAEREAEAQRLGQGVGGRAADHPPSAVRGDQRGDAVVGGEDRRRDEVAGRAEEPHPAHPDEQPRRGEQPAAGEPLAARRRRSRGRPRTRRCRRRRAATNPTAGGRRRRAAAAEDR